MSRPTPQERFWAKVSDHPSGCWVWTAGKSNTGYGSFRYNDRTHNAHRLAWLWLVGSLPEGLVLDHLCLNRACVNPAHLEPVSTAENIRRGLALRTHCFHGHEWTEENTLYTQHGHRKCRECNRLRDRARWPARYAKKKAARDRHLDDHDE